MPFSVCSPSYKRPKVKTLEVYPHTKVFVAESEYGAYVEANPEGSIIIAIPDAVQGNVSRVRNYILDHEFDAGMDGVVMLDDDMRGIYRFFSSDSLYGKFGYNERLLDESELYYFIEAGFSLCEEWGYRLWGVNPIGDAKAYCQTLPFSTISFIGGPFQAFINCDLRYDERLSLKEDYDMTLQQLKAYGGCLRFNAYHYKCEQSSQAGGCASYRSMAEEKRQFDLLQHKWGSKIIGYDKLSSKGFDYNPNLKSPLRGA